MQIRRFVECTILESSYDDKDFGWLVKKEGFENCEPAEETNNFHRKVVTFALYHDPKKRFKTR